MRWINRKENDNGRGDEYTEFVKDYIKMYDDALDGIIKLLN